MSQRGTLSEYDAEFLVALYERMWLIRAAGRAMADLVERGESPGSAHRYEGQEAVAVGACAALEPDDLVAGTHRGHAHAIAKGVDLGPMMAEFCGRTDGLCSGRGGEMHMFDPAHGVLETTGIVAAHLPHLAGAIWADHLDGGATVGVGFFGDGAANQGILYETMNMASIWDLPVVFLCENNQYAATTSREYSTAGDRISDRSAGFDVPGETIDGQDVVTVHETVRAAVEAARAGGGPRFVECETYRYGGHYSAEERLLEDRQYRTDDEIAGWQRRDPVRRFADRLVSAERLTRDDLDAAERRARSSVDVAVEFALASEFPPGERAVDGVYADQDYDYLPAPSYR